MCFLDCTYSAACMSTIFTSMSLVRVDGVYQSGSGKLPQVRISREMLKTSKKAAPPVFRKVAWGRGLVGDPGVLAVFGFRKSLRAGSVLYT